MNLQNMEHQREELHPTLSSLNSQANIKCHMFLLLNWKQVVAFLKM